MGGRARESVKEKFLLSRYLEQYLDLFNAIEPVFKIRGKESQPSGSTS